MATRNLRRLTAAVLAASMLTAAACGGDDDDTGSADDGAGSEDGGSETGTLTLWHYEGPNSAMGIAWDEAIAQFEEAHPGVTVEFEEKGFEQIRQTANMVLNSDEGPDIMEYNKGNASAGLLASQGLLTDITDVAAERGWDELLSESLQTTARYDESGTMGSGAWYGVPNYGEYVMVYYNADMFAERGLEEPTTLTEFEAIMDGFVDEGITPLSVGGSEYPAQQILYELALSQADRSWVDAFQLYEGDVDFQGEEWTYAADTMASWVEAGYISEDSTSITAEDMGVAWMSGDFPMMISGSWWYGRAVNEIEGFEFGTFLFPGNDLHPGSSGNLWVVPESSDQKELAYDFIDITMQPDIQALLGNNGGVPVAADVSEIEGEKNQELIEGFNSVLDTDGLAFYPDWPVPGYYDVMVAATQNLISGSSTDSVLSEIEGPYEDYVSTLG
ncbi:MAG: extracellular solute-binding protein [Actinomycetota bacterium]|nr:extracellular solute-binding protein [Actinomycetota bacterium]